MPNTIEVEPGGLDKPDSTILDAVVITALPQPREVVEAAVELARRRARPCTGAAARTRALDCRGNAMTTRWYVVHTQPNGEGRAERNLQQQGFATYVPRYLRKRRHARRTETVARPLFPRYLFVALDLARDRWRSIYSTFGVAQLVGAADEPRPVPCGVVEEIRAREGEHGFVMLGLPAGLAPGSKVRLIDGVFADACGVLERIADERRVAILLQLLGREVRVFVSAATVGAI